MKVYIVTTDWYGANDGHLLDGSELIDTSIHGVYSTEKRAKQKVQELLDSDEYSDSEEKTWNVDYCEAEVDVDINFED